MLSIGMYICHTRRPGRHDKAKGRPVVFMPAGAIVTKSNFANQHEVVLELELDPTMTPYTLMPTTYEPNEFGTHSASLCLSCYSLSLCVSISLYLSVSVCLSVLLSVSLSLCYSVCL